MYLACAQYTDYVKHLYIPKSVCTETSLLTSGSYLIVTGKKTLFFCKTNSHMLYTTFMLVVHHIYLSCAPHFMLVVHHIYVSCAPHLMLDSHHIYAGCAPHFLLVVNHIYVGCAPHLFFSCTPHFMLAVHHYLH